MLRVNPALTSSLFSTARASTRSSVRTYATSPSSSGSQGNLPLYLGLGGLVGLGTWIGLGGWSGKPKFSGTDAKEAIKDVKGSIASATSGGALSKDKFIDFKLKEVVPYNHDSSTFVFELPDGTPSGLTLASAVLTKGSGEGPKDKDGKPVIRPYTPVTSPDTTGHIDFLIKKYPGGALTEHIHSLKPGETLAIKGPIPKFPYKANQFEEVGMIAGGTGITPMWQVIQAVSNDKSDKTKVTLIYTNKSEADILLREKFDDLTKNDERFKVVYGLDKLPKGFKGFEGYITPEIISQHMPAPGKADKVKVFVCGPPPQVEAISGNKGPKGSQGDLKGLLADAGYQADQIYKF